MHKQVTEAVSLYPSGHNILNEIAACQTSYDIFIVLKSVCQDLKYSQFMVLKIPDSPEFELSKIALITNWNPELIRAYDALNILGESPVINVLRTRTVPFNWSLSRIYKNDASQRGKKLSALFEQFEIDGGIYVPVVNLSGNRGAVGLAGKNRKLNDEETARFCLISTHIYARLITMEEYQPSSVEVLTDREQECIRWTAAGKSSCEVGTILGISENTVNRYLSNASAKLDTANKTHTVAKAIRLGLLN